MRRTAIAVLAVLALLASLANPHFLRGGAFDVYGLGSWWQAPGAVLDLLGLACGAVLLWRGAPAPALRLLAAEVLVFALLTTAAVLRVGSGYLADGWGGTFVGVLWIAIATRLLLLGWAYWARAGSRAPAT